MNVKLLTEHHLEFLSLKEGCRGSSQNVKLLEISCRGSIYILDVIDIPNQLCSTWALYLV